MGTRLQTALGPWAMGWKEPFRAVCPVSCASNWLLQPSVAVRPTSALRPGIPACTSPGPQAKVVQAWQRPHNFCQRVPRRSIHMHAAPDTQQASVSSASSEATAGEGLGALKRKVAAARERLSEALSVSDVPAMKAKLADLENQASSAGEGGGGLWDDPTKAQALLGRITHLRSEMEALSRFESQLGEAEFAVELLEESQAASPAEVAEILREANASLSDLDTALGRWETRRLLSGPYDDRDARITITAGAGGLDAQDWAEMLERMYLRWAEANGYKARSVERSVGEEAGLKSSELIMEGPYAYGHLRSEKGTHRLVRNSPFNAKGLRQTSFAGVEVMPILGDMQVDLDIKESDLQMSFQRASGAGGQNVNKVETGVRITHVPTGISVKCTQERSQQQNRAIAMDMLKAKLLVVLEEQAAQKVAEIRGDMVKAEWGQQIRNYVLHPYRLVKDTRTGEETSDVGAVLDGEGLAPFINAYLRLKGKAATSQELGVEADPSNEHAGARGS